MSNLLTDIDDRLTFAQYAVSDHWTGAIGEDGLPLLTTSIDTVAGVPYALSFNLAANLSADVENITIDVHFAGDAVGSFTHEGGVFDTYAFELEGTGGSVELEFRVTNLTSTLDSSINTTGVIPSYTKTVTFLGNEVTVQAFAPGQSYIYQVLNGQLVKFDLETNSYTEAETPAAVNVNAVGYSIEDDLIYGIARSDGVDAAGVAIQKNDVIAMDATGATYKVSPGLMGSYIGDVDDRGNLWVFSGGLTTAVVYDLSETNPDGTLVHQTVTMPPLGMATRGLADLAYHAATQTFFGVAHVGASGLEGALVSIDVSGVALGEDPVITSQAIAGTIVGGDTRTGIPAGAFGATMVDADGSVYIGANNTDHDLDAATPNSGGFYQITTGADGALSMELLADAPQVSSNDGAMDTRGVDPFLGIDNSSAFLLRLPEVSVALAEDDRVRLAAKGDEITVDLLANDATSAGESLTLTHLNGAAVATGYELALGNGETVRYLGDGRVAVTPGTLVGDAVTEVSYTIQNSSGVTDTATLRIETSPVQGGAGDDHMVGFTDADGTRIDGPDGMADVILGYGGGDKIFAGMGDDDIFGGSGNDFIRAEGGNDSVYGEAGADVLDGGSGADSMFGGAGNDIYFVDSVEDLVSEDGGDGTDTVKSKVDFVLGDGFEHLWLLQGTDAVNATGNALRNMIVGNEQDNVIDGLGDNDTLIGRDGDDIIRGGSGNDKLHGKDGLDQLFGGSGNDKLHGGAGADIAYGNDGDDTLCPGLGDDTMFGGAGRDLLSGNAGADVAYGGLGDDTYKVTDALDIVIEYAGEGHDVVHARADFTLSDHVEDLVFLGDGDLSGNGNAAANRLTGNAGNNVLAGSGGDDLINGMSGDDELAGEAGADKLLGRLGNDVISGGDGADTVSGGGGDDVLTGGRGDDRMSGNAGADTFVFQSGDGRDAIKGFAPTEDRLHLFGVEAADLSWSADVRGIRIDYGADDSILLRGLTADDAATIEVLFF